MGPYFVSGVELEGRHALLALHDGDLLQKVYFLLGRQEMHLVLGKHHNTISQLIAEQPDLRK
jgi:hypothetical protein